MAPDFGSYLASQLISEKQTISYRNVSRALKVHVNSAKLMLYDFYNKQNKKAAGSIYATYLISGNKRQDNKSVLTNGDNADRMNEDDPPPPSSPSPFPSSMIDPSQRSNREDDKEEILVKTISLVREEDLASVQAQYENITSIHIYSLSPGRLEDLVVLTDVGRGIYTETFVKEDPLTNNKTYGVIQNAGVRRRKGKRPTVVEAQAVTMQPMKQAQGDKTTTTKPTLASSLSKDSKEESRPGSRDSSISASSTKQPNLKRDGSNLFKAFAKAQNKPKLERKDTDASTNASASGREDVKMTDAEDDDEGESEDEALFLDTGARKAGTSRKRTHELKKEREDKQAKLRKMMDDSSEDDDEDGKRRALPNVEDASSIKAEPVAAKKGGVEGESANNADEEEDVVWSESDTEKQRQSAPHKDTSSINDKNGEDKIISTEPRRKRGKRKVIKKRTTKDEDGYLVTKEEAVWESFSEADDEPENDSKSNKPNEKPKNKNNNNTFSSTKGSSQAQSQSQKSTAGGGGGKGGTTASKKKGDIMSFFGKR